VIAVCRSCLESPAIGSGSRCCPPSAAVIRNTSPLFFVMRSPTSGARSGRSEIMPRKDNAAGHDSDSVGERCAAG